jgi:hypothetical protein
MAMFLKLWSVAVRQVVRDVPRVVSEEKAERLNDTLAHVRARSAFVVDLQKKVSELLLSITSFPTIFTLENTVFTLVYRKMWLW